MIMFIHFFCLCPLSLAIKLNFNISKVAYCLINYLITHTTYNTYNILHTYYLQYLQLRPNFPQREKDLMMMMTTYNTLNAGLFLSVLPQVMVQLILKNL